MDERTLGRINRFSFLTALSAIALGVAIGVLGVWGLVPHGVLWRLLGTDAIAFAGAVLSNLAIACYRKPGGAIA